jgi:hypothetical protein
MANQARYFDFGKVYDNLDFTSMGYSTHPAGPYRGLTLSADAFGNLEIAIGSGVLPDGFVWSEPTAQTVAFTPQVAAADWTVVAVHVNQQIMGGTSVTYELRVGFLPSATDGAVLGWIRYPGGTIPLATAHCWSAPSQLGSAYAMLYANSLPDERLAPFNNSNGCFTQVPFGANCTITSVAFDAFFVVHQDITRAAAGLLPPELVIQHLQIFASGRPSQLRLYCDVPGSPATSLTVGVYGTDLAPVATTGGTITNTVGWEERIVVVDPLSGVFTAGLPWTIRLTHSLDLGISIKLARIHTEFWPYP